MQHKYSNTHSNKRENLDLSIKLYTGSFILRKNSKQLLPSLDETANTIMVQPPAKHSGNGY